MSSVGPQLKALRQRAMPALTIRKMAEELEIGYSRYAYFEDEKRYKKPTLPLELARSIADVLSRHGVDAAEVMKLAGLNDAEAESEAREIEAAHPTVQFVTLSVALPSEAALTDMFRTMLVAVPAEASRDEAARILAQLLPSGFASIGPAALVPGMVEKPAAEAGLRSLATDDHGSERPLRN